MHCIKQLQQLQQLQQLRHLRAGDAPGGDAFAEG
jgi:hypothetical protein